MESSSPFAVAGLGGDYVVLTDILHADSLMGTLSEVLRLVTRPVANTLADLDVYAGVSHEALFPTPAPVTEAQVSRRWSIPGLVSEDIIFPSQHVPLEPKFRKRYEDEYPEVHTVYARRLRPAGSEKRPRLLYLHGYMQPETYLEEISVLAGLALFLNVEVIQLQPPYHGRRTPTQSLVSGELYMTADLVRSFEALRQSLMDGRSMLEFLLGEDDRPVGVAGVSLGGSLTLGLACVEDRFRFAVPLIAHMDLEALVADVPVLRQMRRDLRRFGWRRADLRRFAESVGWNDLQPKLSPDQILMIAASDDRFFDPKIVEAMWQRWGEPEIHWYSCSHMGFVPRIPLVGPLIRRHIDRFDESSVRDD